MTHRRFLPALAVAGLFFVGSPALPVVAVAQNIEFDQVGDIPLDADDLEFDQEGTLWADADELYRLLAGTGTWEEVNAAKGVGGSLLVLSPDTLFLGSNSSQGRSTDGGQTFFGVYDDGPEQFAASVSGPNHGVILVGTFGDGPGIAYSTDRGASFTEATFTVSTSSTPFMEDAVEILDGPATGRLVAGVFGGVVISEDSGQTWEPSSLFQDARFWVQRVVIGTNPATGNRRLYASVLDAQDPNAQLYVSDDDGLTWSNTYEFPWSFFLAAVPPPPNGDGTLLAMTGADGFVFRSEDGGTSWVEVGQVPFPFVGHAANDMLTGPDGRLYVAVGRGGVERAWVYRTTEPVVVANEPEAPPAPTAERLVVYPNPATDRITVEASGMGEEAVLLDLLGRAVLRARLVNGKVVLDTSLLPAGAYIVRVGAYTQPITLLK